jgi:hypothetical protein
VSFLLKFPNHFHFRFAKLICQVRSGYLVASHDAKTEAGQSDLADVFQQGFTLP